MKMMSYKSSVHIHTEKAEHFTPINQLLCTTINLFSVFKLYADHIFMDYNISKNIDSVQIQKICVIKIKYRILIENHLQGDTF